MADAIATIVNETVRVTVVGTELLAPYIAAAQLAETNAETAQSLAEAAAAYAAGFAGVFDGLVDDLPSDLQILVRDQSRASLLIGHAAGFELDFTRAYAGMAAVKIAGEITVSPPDAFLAVTNTGLPTITNADSSTGLPPHNLFLNSETPATGNSPANMVVGQSYRVSMEGAGSLTITRPLGVGGAAIGTVTQASPLTFTAADTQIRVSAITGAVTRYQLQRAAGTARYLASGASERYGVAISKHASSGEMRLMIDPASFQDIVLTLAAIPALGSEWLAFVEFTLDALGSGSGYLFGVWTDGANYYRLRDDGLVSEAAAGVGQFTMFPPHLPVADELYSLVVRSKGQKVVVASQGTPSGNLGSLSVDVFVPTKVTLGSWASTGPPSKMFIRRFAILPVA